MQSCAQDKVSNGCQCGRTLQSRFGVDVADHPFPLGVSVVSGHGKHGLDAVIGEDIRVPVAFLPAAGIDGPYPALDRIDGETVWAEKNDRPQLLMCGMHDECLCRAGAVVLDPEISEASRPMGMGDATKGRDKERMKDVSVYDMGDDQ
nr:hypothetical protein CFP56_00448 [Quercus suber]